MSEMHCSYQILLDYDMASKKKKIHEKMKIKKEKLFYLLKENNCPYHKLSKIVYFTDTIGAYMEERKIFVPCVQSL